MQAAAPTTHQFTVAMTCGGCEKAVRAVMSKTEGVTAVDVDLATKKVCVTGTASKELLLERLAKTGKKTEYVGTGCQ
jgi:copper chaperone